MPIERTPLLPIHELPTGSLSSGVLRDATVTCPWHGWAYQLHTGKAIVPPVGIRIRVFAVTISDGMIYADIEW
jgi:nitrite reductase/ring-hydroxylating ferredoxin subunit